MKSVTQKVQYNDKILEHLDLDCYTPLNKDPTDSLNRKLDSVLKKLLKEKKIDKPFFDSCRTSNPRRPQLYGLPKIHKPGNPIRPIVSFYNTPLSSLHKQLSIILKPLTISLLRLKDSSDFVKHLNSSSDPNYSYYCSLDVKSLYTSCDMRLAAKTVLDKLQEDPTILPDNITFEMYQIMKEGGYNIAIKKMLEFQHKAIFKEYIEYLYSKKKLYSLRNKKLFEFIIKIMINSFYGSTLTDKTRFRDIRICTLKRQSLKFT